MSRYNSTAIFFHWAMFFLMTGLFIVGFYMGDMPKGPEKLQMISMHKWAGITALLLVTLRLTWRLFNPPPVLPSGMAAWQRSAAQLTHWGLYALMIAMPLSGWMMSSAKGYGVVWFGVLPLPDLVSKDEAMGELFEEAHEIMAFVILAVVGLHVAAALKHHLLDRDDVLTRMLPFLKSRS